MNSSPDSLHHPSSSFQRAAVAHASEILEERRQRYRRELRRLCTKMERWGCVEEAGLIRAELTTANRGGFAEASKEATGFREFDAMRLRYLRDQSLVREHLMFVDATVCQRQCAPKANLWRNLLGIFGGCAAR